MLEMHFNISVLQQLLASNSLITSSLLFQAKRIFLSFSEFEF